MKLYVFLIARLVPILLGISVALVAGRWLHDRFVSRGMRKAGRWIFGIILAMTGVASALSGCRVGFLAVAIDGGQKGDWKSVDRSFRRYALFGGPIDTAFSIDWAEALIQQRRLSAAREVLFSGAGRKAGRPAYAREAVLMIGQCDYYEGRLAEAEKALRVATPTENDYLRSYLLARIAEKRGNFPEARAGYEESLHFLNDFFPAFYCLVRLDLQNGASLAARNRISDFRQRSPVVVEHSLYPMLLSAVETNGPILADVDFYVTP